MAHVVAVGCVDPRVQEFYERYMRDKLGGGQFYNVRLAGCCHDVWQVMRQIDTIQTLTRLEHVVLLPHENCRMYGGSDDLQVKDLMKVKGLIRKLYPDIMVSTFMVHLDGKFVGLSIALG